MFNKNINQKEFFFLIKNLLLFIHQTNKILNKKLLKTQKKKSKLMDLILKKIQIYYVKNKKNMFILI